MRMAANYKRVANRSLCSLEWEMEEKDEKNEREMNVEANKP